MEDEQFVGELEKELYGELKNLLKAPLINLNERIVKHSIINISKQLSFMKQ